VVQSLVEGGVEVDPQLLYWWIRLSGQARQIKAGSYEISRGPTPHTLLNKLVRGEVAQRSVTLAEGLTFAQWREILRNAPHLRPESRELDNAALMAKLGRPGVHPEGRFFPSTDSYAKGSCDLALLRRAMQEMDQRLAAAWAQRVPDSPLKSPDEALILASIVEKETGRASDRGQISGVFNNRLRQGMLLQTDPTVIYGLGDKFDGNLRKRDLQTDTPWNTYTRAGLPPTPIAMPGQDALLAAVQPEKTTALYFVARGDGTSAFSDTLQEHNRAVRKYQLGQR
ncbi:MAG: endolytic transglycosylase MltG, partial [Curvibacter sp.]